MTRATITIEYVDGHTDVINPNRPALLLAMERKYGIQRPERHEQVFWLAWHALGEPEESLDAWLESVEIIEETDAKEGNQAGDEGSVEGKADQA